MVFKYRKVESSEIKKRTFEGKTDPSKNNHSLTSKYMPSYKYYMKVNYELGTSREDCFRTRKDAEDYLKVLKNREGKIV